MLKIELLEIIANGENSGVEFKRDDIRPEQLAKEIVAMVNFQGGRVILGVEDDGTVSGLQRENTEEWVMNIIKAKIHPLLLPFYEEVKVDNKVVAVITFPQGISKPYVLRDRDAEKIYIRVGSTSRLASREQQMRLFELGGMLHTEALPVPRTDISCLDMARLQNYLGDILNDPEVPQNDNEWRNRLLGLGFLVDAGGVVYCSVAGLVLFGKNPRRYLKQAGIRIFSFQGKEKEYKSLMDEILDAPLVGRWSITKAGKELIDNGLIEKFLDQAKPFIVLEPDGIDENFRRAPQWFYPYDAVRESVVNALAHRDWTRYVDFRGMGVRTKLIPLMRANNECDPLFEVTGDYLKVTLYRKGAVQ